MQPLCSNIEKENKGHLMLSIFRHPSGDIIWGDVNSYRTTLVAQLTVTQQGLAFVYEGISLLIVQILQLVYIILAFGLSFSYVNIRQNLLDYCNL